MNESHIQRIWMNYPFKMPFGIVFAADYVNKNRGGEWTNRLSELSRCVCDSDCILQKLHIALVTHAGHWQTNNLGYN